jgi:hypothetical protein
VACWPGAGSGWVRLHVPPSNGWMLVRVMQHPGAYVAVWHVCHAMTACLACRPDSIPPRHWQHPSRCRAGKTAAIVAHRHMCPPCPLLQETYGLGRSPNTEAAAAGRAAKQQCREGQGAGAAQQQPAAAEAAAVAPSGVQPPAKKQPDPVDVELDSLYD